MNQDGKVVIGTEVDLQGFEDGLIKIKHDAEKEKLEFNPFEPKHEDVIKEIEETGMGLKEIEDELTEIDARIREIYKDAPRTVEDIYGDEKIFRVDVRLSEANKEELDNLYTREQLLVKMREQLSPVIEKNKQIKKQTKDIADEIAEASKHMNEWINGEYTLSNGQKLINKEEKKAIEEREKTFLKSVEEAEKAQNLSKVIGEQNLKSINKGLTTAIKKVGRWALAVFGVRSAYLFVRSAMSTITEQDEQLKYDIQYVKAALAYSIEPLVRGIVELAKTLIGYLAYIIKAWTGRDIFAKASKSLASGAESAKEIEKSTASFDKFNKLSANKGGGGSAGGLTAPKNVNPPKWLVWIGKHGKIVKSIILGIVAAITALNLGVGLIPSLVIGAVIGIVAFIISKYDEIIEGFDNVLAWFKGPAYNWLKYYFGKYADVMIYPFTLVVSVAKSIFESIFGGIKQVLDGILDILKGNFTNGIKKVFSGLVDIMLTPFRAIKTAIDETIDAVLRLFGIIEKNRSLLGGGSNSFGGGGGGGARSAKGAVIYSSMPKLAAGGIVNMPGRGIPYRNATIGERGAEAVVPLTDRQQMELLGATIGKYVSVNADITLELESRILARVMKEITNDNQFMRNGG